MAYEVIVDAHGYPMFYCPVCRQALTRGDFFELGLRLPENGENRDEYCDAELLDDVTHIACVQAEKAG